MCLGCGLFLENNEATRLIAAKANNMGLEMDLKNDLCRNNARKMDSKVMLKFDLQEICKNMQ